MRILPVQVRILPGRRENHSPVAIKASENSSRASCSLWPAGSRALHQSKKARLCSAGWQRMVRWSGRACRWRYNRSVARLFSSGRAGRRCLWYQVQQRSSSACRRLWLGSQEGQHRYCCRPLVPDRWGKSDFRHQKRDRKAYW